ncbi:MAG: hypothetical protein ACLFVZ_09465 [Actinomycetota bacterium]
MRRAASRDLRGSNGERGDCEHTIRRLMVRAKECLYGIPIAIVIGSAGLAFLALHIDSPMTEYGRSHDSRISG